MALGTLLFSLSLILFVSPFGCGAVAVRDLLSFRREAFGLYSRSTGLLAAGVVAGLCYYAIVVTTFALRGDLDGLGRSQLTAVQAMLLLQAAVAFLAVCLVRLGGQRLSQIVHPGEAAP